LRTLATPKSPNHWTFEMLSFSYRPRWEPTGC